MMEPASLRQTLMVIPCLNEQAHIGSVLSTLLPQSGEALVVVADGGSSDQTVAIAEAESARWPNLRVIRNPARIQSAAINLAVELFGEGRRWLIRIDAHCGYPEGFARRLIRTAEEKGAQSVTVPMRTVGSRCFERAVAAAQNSKLGTGGAEHRFGTIGRFVDHGHHALMSLDYFRRAGGYCETMTHNEDAELDIRLAAVGGRIWIEPSLAVLYHPRGKPLPLFRQYFSYGVGRARTMLRHRRRLRARQAVPLAVAPAVLVALAAPLWWPLALPASVWMLLCVTWGALIALRARSACELASGPAAMIMHLAWSAGFWKAALARALKLTEDQWVSRFQPAGGDGRSA